MVGQSNQATEFILIRKQDFKRKQQETSTGQILSGSITHQIPENSQNIPENARKTSTEPDNTLITDKVFAELEAISGTRRRENKTWNDYQTILNAILKTPYIDIQLSNLILTLNGEPIEDLKASTFIYSLTQYRKKLSIEKDLLVLPHLSTLKNTSAVHNAQAKQFWQTLPGSFDLGTSQQSGRGLLNGTKASKRKKSNIQKDSGTNPRGIDKKNRAYQTQKGTIKFPANWISL